MDRFTFVNLLINGITLGAVYFLMAFGLTLVYGVTKVLNYAQGSMFTLGGYIAWYLLNRFPDLNYAAVVVITIVIMFIFGVSFERVIVYPLRRHSDWSFVVIIVTLGAALTLDNLILATFGPLSKTLPYFAEGSFNFGTFVVSKHNFYTILVTILLFLIINYFLNKTKEGMAMRAVSQDTIGAKIIGLSIDRLYSYSFGISVALAGMAAILLAPRTLLYPQVGWITLIKAFTVMVLGGLGNIKGAAIAAILLALVEIFVTYFLGGIWALPIFILLMIVILEFKPKGLFGTW